MTMTENGLSAEQRLEQLRSRTSTTATKPRKTHAALGSRIATVGLGASAMLALVTTIDLANQPEVPPTPVERPIMVVVHQQPTSTVNPTVIDPAVASLATTAPIAAPTASLATTSSSTAAATTAATTAPTTAPTAAPETTGPVQLTATPVVTTIYKTAPQAQPAPVAQTNGS